MLNISTYCQFDHLAISFLVKVKVHSRSTYILLSCQPHFTSLFLIYNYQHNITVVYLGKHGHDSLFYLPEWLNLDHFCFADDLFGTHGFMLLWGETGAEPRVTSFNYATCFLAVSLGLLKEIIISFATLWHWQWPSPPFQTPSLCGHTHPWALVRMLPQCRVNIARLYLCCESIRQSVSLFPSEKEGQTEGSSRSYDLWSLLVRECRHAARPRQPWGVWQHTRG